jgi:hypothetical protein
MRVRNRTLGIVALSLAAVVAQAQLTGAMSVKSSFGANGWLAPGASTYLGTSNLARGLAFNPVTGNLVLVSRVTDGTTSLNVRILNGTTGADLGRLGYAGIAGGTFPINMADVADDGSIYVANLSSQTSNFTVYKWASESAGLGGGNPTVVYTAPSSPVNRIGDTFAVRGNRFVAAGSNTQGGTNSAFTVGLLDGSNTSTTYTSVPGTSTSSNDYRLGLTWVDDDTIIGTQGTNLRFTDFDGSSATVTATAVVGAAQRLIDYTEIGGVPYLAIADTNSSLVRVYDVSTPGSPVLVASGNATTGTLSGNTNGVGDIAWGNVNGNTISLYAMSTNQGIQAFELQVVPEPGTMAALGLGAAFLARRRRK